MRLLRQRNYTMIWAIVNQLGLDLKEFEKI